MSLLLLLLTSHSKMAGYHAMHWQDASERTTIICTSQIADPNLSTADVRQSLQAGVQASRHDARSCRLFCTSKRGQLHQT
jgi:hypothetical protein